MAQTATATRAATDPAARTLPLTEAQEGLWYAQRLDPENPIFNTAQRVDIDGPLDASALSGAVSQALAEADALTARFLDGEDGPAQRLGDGPPVALIPIDLRDASNPVAAAEAIMARDGATPLNPTRDALVRELLFRVGERRFIWYQRIHHLVVDGYGVGLLNRRIADLYAARVAGTAPGAPFPSATALLTEDALYRAAPRRLEDRAFWLDRLRDAPPVEGLAPGVAMTAHRFLRHGHPLDDTTAEALHNRAKETDVPWPDLLVALVAAYLRRHLGDAAAAGDEPATGLVVGVPSMNRFGSAAARIPAMVMNVLPVPLTVDEDAPLAQYARAASRCLREARRHGRYRGEQIRRDLGLLGGAKRLHGPLINILPFDETPELPGCRGRLTVLGTGPVDDLTITLRADGMGRGLTLEIDANPSLYDDTTVAEHVERLAVFLDAASRAGRLADVPTLTTAERLHWIEEVNATAHPVERSTLVDRIADQMRRTPDAEAVSFGDRRLTYADLDRASDRLARRLAAAGVTRGAVVGVALPRSLELVVTLLAVQRAGAAYLPLDLDHPAERIARTLRVARPHTVVTFPDLVDRLPADTPLFKLEGGEESEDDQPDAVLEAPTPDDVAYVIFTSGSTGDPKGVVVEHDAIVNRLEWMAAQYGFGPGDRILQKTPATFDVSVWEFFLPLMVGATLVVAPPGAHKDPAWLARLFREERITTAHFVPSMLEAFLAEPAAAGLTPRRVFCSGEELPAALRDRFHALVSAELHNLYGPTEAAVDVTCWPAGPDDRSQPVPIGFPVWNTALYVLDRRGRPVPPGVTGDLFIAGRQLARGYLNRPDLTNDRFVPDPFGPPGSRMYRTGDVARWRRDGALVFLGRSDHQVKLRGLRIELGDIETTVRSAPGVGRAAVIAREDRPGDKRLVAYAVAASPDAPLDPAAVTAHVAALLPDYMVPALVVLDALLVTANGKLDRAALPAPAAGRAAARQPLTTDTERRLAALFAELLGLEGPVAELGGDDDFFALGGHSLVAAQAMRRIRALWPVTIGLGALFTFPTVARLAAHIDSLRAEVPTDRPEGGREGLDVVLALAKGNTLGGVPGVPPVFCLHPAGGISWCYNGLARALGGERAVYGLQARGLDPDHPLPDSLSAMAADYIAEIRAVQPRGPYHLLGWSVGGIIAQEMAAQLRDAGEALGVVALLDAYPSDCWRDEPAPDEGAALKALMQIAGIDPVAYANVTLTRASAIALLRAAGHPLADLPDASLTGLIRVVESNNGMVRRHRHRRYDGPLLHVRAALDHVGQGHLTPRRWAPYADAIERIDVPALHGQLIGAEAVARIAPLLVARLAERDGGPNA